MDVDGAIHLHCAQFSLGMMERQSQAVGEDRDGWMKEVGFLGDSVRRYEALIAIAM